MKEFFVNLYEKFIHLSWVEKTIDYCKNLSWVQWTVDYCKEKPIMAGIIGGLTLFILILLCVMGGVRSKRKKARKAQAAAKAAAEEGTEAAEETAVIAKEIEAVAQEAPAVTAEKELTEQKATAAQEVAATALPAEEKKAEVAEKKAEIVEEKKAETVEKKETAKAAATKAPAKKTTEKKTPTKKQTQAQDAQELLAALQNAKDAPVSITLHEEDETDKAAKYSGKWVVCRVITDDEEHEEMFFFELRASNGEKLLSSEEYTTYQGALRGIETHKSNILKGNFKITVSKKGDYIFKLLSGKNMLLCMGENYSTKAGCESAIESTMRFAETAVLDENVQDILIKVPKEDENAPLPTLSENVTGKWIISSKKGADGEAVYFFELFANNGEKLLSSEEYTTYTGAVNGIQTHKRNIEQNNFRISLTKRGDYIYKLLNGNGQLLCLGEHYKTKRLCQNAVDSVQRFALNSSVHTSEKK